jgi:hypothetical protein
VTWSIASSGNFEVAYGNPRGARVYGVFHQFFQRAGGAFDHFSGSDTVDKMFGQTAY